MGLMETTVLVVLSGHSQRSQRGRRADALITLLGSEGLKIYDTFTFTVGADARKIQSVLDKFTDHFEPRRSEVFERLKFLRRHQTPGETLDSWLIDLRGLVKTCNYGTSVDSVLRNQIVLGVADPLVRENFCMRKI